MPDTVDAKYLIANYDLFLVLEIVIFFSFPNYFALTLLFYLTPIFFSSLLLRILNLSVLNHFLFHCYIIYKHIIKYFSIKTTRALESSVNGILSTRKKMKSIIEMM